jgi:hypothetical protein
MNLRCFSVLAGMSMSPLETAAGRRVVIVRVRRRVVVLLLVLFAPVVVRMDEWRMVVVVLVIVRLMGELAERAARVLVGDVVVVVRVDDAAMRVLMLDVADNALDRDRWLHGAPPFGDSCVRSIVGLDAALIA